MAQVFVWGEKRDAIAMATRVYVNREAAKSGTLTILKPLEEVRLGVKECLFNRFSPTTMELTRAILKDEWLGKIVAFSREGGVRHITLHSEEMRLAIEIVKDRLKKGTAAQKQLYALLEAA